MQGERVKFKTRGSLKTIKSFDLAEIFVQKSKSGASSLKNSAEQTQMIKNEYGKRIKVTKDRD